MTRTEFFVELRKGLVGLPQAEIEKVVGFYLEAIADRTEDGMDELSAVAELGDPAQIAANIKAETASIPVMIASKVKESHDNSSNKVIWIVLAIVGSPIWIPLLLSLFSVVIALYATAIALVIAFFAVLFSLFIGFIAVFLIALALIFSGNIIPGLALFGSSLFILGLALFLSAPVTWLAKKTFGLAVVAVKSIKRKIMKSGGAV